MAIDLVARPIDGCLTLVHDDQEMDVRALSVEADGVVSVMGAGGKRVIGQLTGSMIGDVRSCRRAVVVRMFGSDVAAAGAVPFENRTA